jgi:hypothetical protein
VSDLSESEARKASAKPGIRSFPVCQRARNPEIRYIWKLSKNKNKRNPKRGFFILFYFFGLGRSVLPRLIDSSLFAEASFRLIVQIYFLFVLFVLFFYPFFIIFTFPVLDLFLYYFSFLGISFSRLQGCREV